MAKTWTYRLGSARHTQAARQLLVFLLTAQPTSLLAQEQTPPSAAPSYPPNVPVNIINGDSLLAAATSTALPSSTDNANYATHNNGSSGSPEHGILNYYFLLLAVFIVIIALAYWSLARRRRRRINALRNNQQNALARDIETWPGLRRAGGWRHSAPDDASPEEGLNERGEAPPAYVKEPERAHLEGREGVELRDLGSREGKPPNYESEPAR